ncbi:hypothetical protein GCM10008171_27450 [Methylopila jiangsuensis]|uniref:Uncharacterized protein n=1 Tax=Methylopila jiangsuensis TaxID=586230 RepID=A0A9W6JH25_9HYPH|nr:hypothetical protein [Methylopila jiangsuensis]MDR6285122.1 hypothetical protein [Methylopila jiangsuensis]GLK77491.1 hypothetical protein GCM10008171_27450 [Methylopila jiangsuensis]
MSRALAVLAAAALLSAVQMSPAAAQSSERRSASSGVAITITKQSNYLNTRTVARPNSRANYDTSAVYQSSTPTRGPGGFERWPLPSTFTLPGY